MPRSATREPRWASFKAASAYAGIPTRTLRDWVSRGRLPAYRIGPRQIQVDLNDIDAIRVRIPTAEPGGNGGGGAVLPLTPDEIRAIAREVAALSREGDGGGDAS
jgi:excisionase family DNA binding protein